MAIQALSWGTGGVAGGAGIGFCHSSMYPCPNFENEQYDVFTNAGPCAAFRAPGQVQGIFSLEQMIDDLAEKLGVDPLVLRDTIDTKGTDDSLARAFERRVGAEERHLDPGSGHQLNANIDQYKMVGSRETPEIEVVLLEQLGAQSSTDARGVAEPANVGTAAAIANAFYNATGKRIRTLPMTPANVLAALRG